MAKRVFLATRNLMFRAKLGSAVAAAGGEVTRDEAACDLIVLELADAAAAGRVAELVRRGMTVLAYGSHIQPEVLRAARAAGATAVPNSEVERHLRELVSA